MRLEDSLLVTISCVEVSSDSLMACGEPWIGGWILGDEAYLAAIEINQKMHSTPNKTGLPITQSAWLIDSVWGIGICESDSLLDMKLKETFDPPSAYNSLLHSEYAERVRLRCEPILHSSEYDTRSGLFVIKRDIYDVKLIVPDNDSEFFDELRKKNAVVKKSRDVTIETVLTELGIDFTAII